MVNEKMFSLPPPVEQERGQENKTKKLFISVVLDEK